MPSPLILLVDDDDSLATLLSNRLRREGYSVKSCGDAAQANDLLKSHRIENWCG